tara:strand:+ start:2219 stop:2551 length:333 start_codon:yes stop_codon:yes gene_type:complete
MVSLLTEELNMYDFSNITNNKIISKNINNNNIKCKYDNTKNDEIKTTINKTTNKAININKAINNEYSLNIHIFNPAKNSPPNYWQYRLENRIKYLNNIFDNHNDNKETIF